MSTLNGKIVSHIDAKTAIVLVDSFVIHPKYKKSIARSKKFIVHDEMGIKDGQVVSFVQIRPMSKRKTWKIVDNSKKGKA